MFRKVDNGTAVFYALPGYDSKYVVKNFLDFDNDSLAEYMNHDDHFDFTAYGTHKFKHRVHVRSMEDVAEMPPGTYKFFPFEDPNNPSRFQVFPTRKEERYIKLPEIDILKNDMQKFIQSKDLFKELGFAYRRGYLLHGRPGNGKTALIRSLLSDELLEEAQIIWLPEIPDDSLINALNQQDTLKVVVFEEIIDKYNNVKFSLSDLLNFMDGENSLKNCITIATTNYPEFLGENLANRPSRFDVVLNFKDPSDESVYVMMEKLLGRDVRSEFKNNSFSFAQVKEIVLLHKMHLCTLQEAAKKLEEQGKQFERGFEEAKNFGFGV